MKNTPSLTPVSMNFSRVDTNARSFSSLVAFRRVVGFSLSLACVSALAIAGQNAVLGTGRQAAAFAVKTGLCLSEVRETWKLCVGKATYVPVRGAVMTMPEGCATFPEGSLAGIRGQ